MRELLHEVLPPELHAIHPELGGERVHRALEDVRRLRAARAAIRVGRRRMREDTGERDAVVRDRVRAGVDPRAEERNPRRDELEVGAHRALRLRLHGRDRPVLRRRERQLVDGVAPVDGRNVVLRPLLRPLHRPAESLRQRDREELLRVDVELRAEAASHVRCDHAHLRLRDAEDEGHREAQDVRHLRRGPERDVARRTDLREHSSRLDRVRDQARLDVAPRHDDVRCVDRGLRVARLELPDVALVRLEFGVDERSVVREGSSRHRPRSRGARSPPRRAQPRPWQAHGSRRRRLRRRHPGSALRPRRAGGAPAS